MLELLDKATKKISKGPYILSDKRWMDNNVYFRYGGFVEMFTVSNGRKELAIINDKGKYIVDKRGPSYILPDFIQEPDAIKKMDAKRDKQTNEPSPLDEYTITEALHFSNGGGVYLATHKKTEQQVVIKEGRPGAGIDATGRDAFERVQHEAEVLKGLVGQNHIVQYFDNFQVWEHTFLVEEHVNGSTLNTWLALNYPFVIGSKDAHEYGKKVITILDNIQAGLFAMHVSGTAMGDLSLTNVLLDPGDLSIKFIDFEAADDINSTKSPGLATVGFVSPLTKTREQADWFGFLRIARQLFLPIGDVNDIDSSVEYKHNIWIEEMYGIDAIKKINEIEGICIEKIPRIKNYWPKYNYYANRQVLTVPNLIQKFRNSMMKDLKLSKQLLHGDIRQYEFSGGKINVLTGGFGVILALSRTGKLPDSAYEWANRYSQKRYIKELDDGLFTGKAGVATVLYELGLKKQAREVFDSITLTKDPGDVSLISGLAGIGLALLSVSDDPMFRDMLPRCIEIAIQLQNSMESDVVISSLDIDFVTMGLIDGWAGVSLFLTALYRATQNPIWLELSTTALAKDLNNCKRDEYGALNIDDKNRFLPYLAGGSIGVAIAIYQIRDLIDENCWNKEFDDIAKLVGSRICYNPGLFRGMSSFIVLNNTMQCYGGYTSQNTERLINQLNLYLVEDENNIYCPGDYGYRLSHDVFSGSSGLILVLADIGKKSCMSWLPLPKNPFLLA